MHILSEQPRMECLSKIIALNFRVSSLMIFFSAVAEKYSVEVKHINQPLLTNFGFA